MARSQEEIDYIKQNQAGTLAGRTLVGNPNDEFISSSILAPTPSITLPPYPEDLTNYGATIAGTIPTPFTSKVEKTTTDIESLLGQLSGKESYSQQQENLAGVDELQAEQDSLTAQIKALNTQSQNLQKQSEVDIPNQMQLESEGRGRTVGGLAPLTAGALRINQIKQGQIATQALTLSATYDLNAGRLKSAQTKAQKAVDLKYKPIEEAIDRNAKLLELYMPFFNREEKKRAEAQQLANEEKKTAVADKKKLQQDIINIAQANGDSSIASLAMQLDPNSSTFVQDLSALQAKIKPKPVGQSDFEQAFLRDKGYLPSVNDILDYKAREAAAGRAPAKGGITVPITATNKPYIDAFNSAVTGMPANRIEQAQTTFSQLLSSGDTEGAKSYIVRTAMANAGVDQQNQAIGRTQAIAAMNDIENLLKQAKEKGANTNILTGTLVNIGNRLGASPNTDLSYIGSRIMQALIVYRKGMTGVAFGAQEAKDYKKIFSDITNIESLNTAKISALRDALNSNNRAALAFYIGDTNYEKLFGKEQTSQLPSSGGTSGGTIDLSGLDFKF